MSRSVRSWGDGEILYLNWDGGYPTVCFFSNLKKWYLKGSFLLYENCTSIDLSPQRRRVGMRVHLHTQVPKMRAKQLLRPCWAPTGGMGSRATPALPFPSWLNALRTFYKNQRHLKGQGPALPHLHSQSDNQAFHVLFGLAFWFCFFPPLGVKLSSWWPSYPRLS